MSHVVLLGPQRFDPSAAQAVRDLAVDGRVATVTAGWQEREPDDAELDELLDGRSVNLHLYGRWLDISERDPDFADADLARREVIDEVQATYLLRLHHALQSLLELHARGGTPSILEAAVEDAIRGLRDLDGWHLARVDEVHEEFHDRWRPHERPVIAQHRAEVQELMGQAGALAIAGGHVGVLLWTLHLLNVGGLIGALPVVAWSAGAMAITETVVLFHDHAVHGFRHAEVFDRGLGLARGVVALPHARRRLDIDDERRMSLLARRFAPARCLVLDDGVEVRLGDGDGDGDGGAVPVGSLIVTETGAVAPLAA